MRVTIIASNNQYISVLKMQKHQCKNATNTGLQCTIYRRSLYNATQATESYAADLTLPTADLISKFLENKQMLKSYNRCLSVTCGTNAQIQ